MINEPLSARLVQVGELRGGEDHQMDHPPHLVWRGPEHHLGCSGPERALMLDNEGVQRLGVARHG